LPEIGYPEFLWSLAAIEIVAKRGCTQNIRNSKIRCARGGTVCVND
jgi:hypothetical protein